MVARKSNGGGDKANAREKGPHLRKMGNEAGKAQDFITQWSEYSLELGGEK